MSAEWYIYYSLWTLVTVWLIWRLHDDHKATQAILDRMDRRTVLMARYLGMEDTDGDEVP